MSSKEKVELHFRVFVAGEELALRNGGTLGVLAFTAEEAAEKASASKYVSAGEVINVIGGKPNRFTRWLALDGGKVRKLGAKTG